MPSTPRNIRRVNGEPVKPLAHYDANDTFTGQFELRDPERHWGTVNQTGVLTFSESPDSNVGGSDCISLVANGSAINVPGAWKNIGSASISTVNGDVNRIIVSKTPSEIWYSVKVN